MSRSPRLEVPGGIYHVISGGSNRGAIYRRPSDRTMFEELLAAAAERHDWRCHAYCWMTNHYHLVLQIADGGLSAGMQYLNGGYSRRFNRRHGRVAHAFRNRFTSRLIETEAYFLRTCRYVVLNPVRAGLTRSPAEWPWSSYLPTAGAVRCPRFLTDDAVLACFSHGEEEAARRRYADFVREGIATDGRPNPSGL